MICHINYKLDGIAGHVIVHADTSIGALLQWLATVPHCAAVKVIVRVHP